MYRKSNGNWKSDFRLNHIRYQKTWETTSLELALKLEEEWKNHIKKPDVFPLPSTASINLTFSDATEYVEETKWRYNRDQRNPKDRWLRIVKYFGAKRRIGTLTIDDLDRYKRHLVNKKYANKTINHYISTLKSTIEYLEVKQKVILDNKLSFEGLLMRVTSKRKICFTREEESKMYNALVSVYKKTKNQTDWEMIQFFVINSGLGLRPAEYYNLQLGDFDLEQKTVTISRGSYNSTKNDLIRTLPLDGIVLKAVEHQLEYAITNLHNENENITLKTSIKSNQFRSLNFTSLTKDKVRRRWRNMKKYLGWTDKERYKEYIPYGLRHTVASRLASLSKWNGYKIMTFMGHKSFHTSLNYVHLGVDDIRDGSLISNQSIELQGYI
jgi:integrase